MKQEKKEQEPLDDLLSEKDFAIRSILEAIKEQESVEKQEGEEVLTEEEQQPEPKAADEDVKVQEKSHETVPLRNADNSCWLEEVMMWSEILGEPLSKKRRKKRMEQRYANQGYAHRG